MRIAQRLHRFLASPRGAVVAAAAMALATAAAVGLTAVPHPPAEGALRRIFQVLEANDPFRSWWFSAALILAASVGLATLLDALPLVGPAPRIRLRSAIERPVPPEALRELLRSRMPRVRADPEGGYVAERGAWTRLGRPLAGAGGLLLCAGAAVAAFAGGSGLARVREGEIAYGMTVPGHGGTRRIDLGAELQAERIEPGAGWRVVLGRGPDLLAQADVSPGDAFEHGGRRFRLEWVRPVDAPGRFRVAVGEGEPRLVRLGERVAAGKGIEVALTGYDPRFAGRHGPAVQVAWLRAGTPVETGWVFGAYPEFDERVRRSQPPVRVYGYERQLELGIRVEEPRGRWLLVVGALAITFGLLLGAGPPYARIEAWPVEGGWKLRAAAMGDGARLARDLDEIRAAGRVVAPP